MRVSKYRLRLNFGFLVLVFLTLSIFAFKAFSRESSRSLNSRIQSDKSLEAPLPLLRKVSIFPILAPQELKSLSEEAWWKIREAVTANQIFLVASKNFLERKDVFQARGELSPADAIILGELLDADALITMSLKGKHLGLFVYEGKYGRLLWKQVASLNSAVPVKEQFVESAIQLIQNFLKEIPYQGFVKIDSLVGDPVYQRGGQPVAQVYIGANSQVQIGDLIQWFRLVPNNFSPLFMDGANVEVFAEGKVLEVHKDMVIVSVERATSLKQIRADSLVRFPKELRQLKDSIAYKSSLSRRVDPEYYSPEIKDLSKEEKETKPLVASLTFLFNLAGFLLLAF